MVTSSLDPSTLKAVRQFQQGEINSYHIYQKLATKSKNQHNADILQQISKDELSHYEFWHDISKRKVKPQRLKIWLYYMIARIFGLTFGIRLMERGEQDAIKLYESLDVTFPGVDKIIEDEEQHESKLIDMLNEDLLTYVGSIVLGLSDALVELTGALAGFTFALQNTNLIAVAGFIVGVSAAFSMGASEYLSSSEEEDTGKNPIKAALYTGISYFITVILLIAPFLFLTNEEPIVPLALTLVAAIAVILVFTFYISVAKNISFKKRFSKKYKFKKIQIAGITMSVALFSLILGLFVRTYFSIDI